MDVEIDHGHAGGAVLGAGVQRRDGHGVEQAEAHGTVGLGMMARRAHGAEGVAGFAGGNLVDGVDGGTGGPESGIPTLGREDRVGVEPFMVAFGDRRLDHVDIAVRVNALDCGDVGQRGLLALQILEGGRRQRVVDGAQAIGPLGMANARVMQEAIRVGEEQGGHGLQICTSRRGLTSLS